MGLYFGWKILAITLDGTIRYRTAKTVLLIEPTQSGTLSCRQFQMVMDYEIQRLGFA